MQASRVILVTGSSTGLGRLAAETLARRGHRVFASMRGATGSNAAAATELTAVAEQERIGLEVVELDVTSEPSVAAAVATIIEREEYNWSLQSAGE